MIWISKQPICDDCWVLEPTRAHEQPDRVIPPLDEHCCLCGEPTQSGIYARYNPGAVPHPKQD